MKINRQIVNLFIIISIVAIGFVYQNCSKSYNPQIDEVSLSKAALQKVMAN